jgi:hypothetical protein
MAESKALFLASDPFDTHALTFDEEVRAITAQIRLAECRDTLELFSAWAVRPDHLQQLLLQHQPSVVHFSGHGISARPYSGPLHGATAVNRDLIQLTKLLRGANGDRWRCDFLLEFVQC